MRHIPYIILSLLVCISIQAEDSKLRGTIIGTIGSVDYNSGSYSTTVNTREMAFDGRTDTYFASWDRSYTWVGMDLGQPYIITKVGWSPRNDGVGPNRVRLAIFEGANQPDFSDAIPLYMVKQSGTVGVVDYGQVDVSLGVRYVRYVSPGDARCNVSEVEFYGHLGAGDSTKLYQVTNLPTVSIHTVNAEEPYDKEHELSGVVSIITGGGTQLLQDSAVTRLRGNASMQFPKKPYQIKFAHKQRVLSGATKAKKWTLINNYGDKTLMRNLIAFHFDKQLGATYTPFAHPVDVILNGEYKGCYQLSDKVEIGKGRIEIDEMDETCISGEALTGGYLLEIDGYYYQEPTAFVSSRNIPITIQSPNEETLQPAQRNYIQSQYAELENLAFASYYTNPLSGYRQKMDLQSFLIQFLTNQLAANPDNYWSTYFYKPKSDNRFYFGPVWDFDIAFDNDNRQSNQNNASNWLYGSANNSSALPKRIISDPNAVEELRMLYATARDRGLISPERMGEVVDSLANMLEESQTYNFWRWPILSQKVHMNKTARGSYAAEVEYIRDWVMKRVEWVDRKLNYQPGMSHTAVEAVEAVEAEWQNGMPFAIYDATGTLLHVGTEVPQLPHGVYVLRQGEACKKIVR